MQMRGGDAQAGVDAGALGALEGLGGDLDILVDGTRQTTDRAGIASDFADLVHGLEVTGARDGETGLDNIDVHAYELTGDYELFLGVHTCAGRLLAIAQSGVENCDFARHGSSK